MRKPLFVIGTLLLATLAGVSEAYARYPVSMEILVHGRPLEEYHARGGVYVEALEGAEYSVRLTNRTGERVAVALAVDGLNSIDAKTTTAREASKWIVGPWATVTIDGWQTGPATARRFFFTTEDRSYGAWLGKTSNLGVISAAVFREQRPTPRPYDRDALEQGLPEAPRPGTKSKRGAEGEARALSDDLAATGIGRKVGHRVRQVHFDEEPSPASVIEVRYEFHDALVRLGVLPDRRARHDDPLHRRERAHGFEGTEFAPDPFE